MMTSHSKLILVVPRPDGMVVSIEGVTHFRDMNSTQLFWMAERFLNAGLEAQREEQKTENKEARHEEI
jgi:hypothetical protein